MFLLGGAADAHGVPNYSCAIANYLGILGALRGLTRFGFDMIHGKRLITSGMWGQHGQEENAGQTAIDHSVNSSWMDILGST